MIGSLRRRFIVGGMAAMLILLVLLVSGVSISSYIRLEKTDDDFMDMILNESDNRETRADRRRDRDIMPGGMHIRRGYYLIEIDASGAIINVSSRGIWNEDTDEVERLVEKAISSGKTKGRLKEQYKYRIQASDEGKTLMLLDDYVEYQLIGETIRASTIFGLICLGLMFLILLPVSTRVVSSYAHSIERQKQFITNAGHEIKTPLAIIMSNLDAMELIVGENKWSKNIRGQADRLNTLIHRLLFIAKMDENSVRVKWERFDLAGMVRTEIATYREMMEEKEIKFENKIPADMQISGNREYLSQMIHALMDNAAQYTPEGGSIRVELTQQRRKAILTVENNVNALPACSPDQLFERFYRDDKSHSQKGGHGIGLSAAQAITEMHGGKIRAVYGAEKISFIAEIRR